MDLILSSILGPVCERLIDAALKEYRLARDVGKDIRKLGSTVSAIRDVLRDAERKQAYTWLKDLKQVLLDAEDVLDEIATYEALRAKRDAQSTRSFRFLPCLCGVGFRSSSRSIAHQIEGINERFNHITRLKNELGLHHVPGETSGVTVIRRPSRPETNHVLGSHAHIIGRADEMAKMRDLLLDDGMTTSDENNVHVISVVGMGGIGKTTLVQHAYTDPAVVECFKLKMWVCVSNDFDVKRIMKEIVDASTISDSERSKEISAIAKFESSNWDATVTFLHDKIRGRKFLLVLDDVWEEDHSKWDELYNPLSHGAKGSKIIVTTRNKKVSDIAKGTPIFLKDLPKDDLWTIFQNYAFDGIHDPQKKGQLVAVGMQIAEKVKGSPLVAKTIGRLLNSNMEMRHWTDIMKSEALSVGDAGSVLSVLKLSYDHLPGHLKQCFAYCSLFPEDHRFDRSQLVRLWMAQQFVNKIVEDSHEESVGGDCFDYLVHMSLFEKHASYYDDVHVVHDLIHDLMDSGSKNDCLRLMKDDHPKAVNSETIRHMSIICASLDPAKLFENLGQNYKNLRTLLFMKGSRLSWDHLNLLFKKLQRLRVLGLRECNITELPESIDKLRHLRYLDLSFNRDIKKLPESLCNLHNLQVLDLHGSERDLSLPGNMSALVNLRHLTFDSAIASSIRGLGKLTALHELELDCGSRSGGQPILKELESMNMLRKLYIRSLKEVRSKEEADGARLQEKRHLEMLTLRWGKDSDDHHWINPELEGEALECLRPASSIRVLTIKSNRGIRSPSWMEVPSWICPSNPLEVLDIRYCLNWEVLPPLGRLPCLKTLIIEGMKSVKRIGDQYSMDGPVQGTAALFPSLERLTCKDMEEWENWEVPPLLQSSLFLPRLQKLQLKNCPKLRHLPPLPHSLGSLEIEKVGLTVLPPLPPSLQELIIGYNENVDADSLSKWLRGLTSLRNLTIFECSNIMSLPGTEALSHMTTALQTLEIRRLRGLKSFGGFINSRNVLEQLTIADCPELADFIASESSPFSLATSQPPSGGIVSTHIKKLTIQRSSLQQIKMLLLQCHFLQELDIVDCPQLMGFSGDDGGDVGEELEATLLNLSPTLRSLSFWECKNLRSLPPKLRSLTSIQELRIVMCPESLPVGGLPESLRKLEIFHCHKELKERCEEGVGSDWHLISRVPVRWIV